MTWQPKTIGEICLPTSWCDPRLNPDSPFEYIDISGVDRYSKSVRYSQRLLGVDAPSRARKKVAFNDILVSMVRPGLNTVAMVPRPLDGAVASTGFCVLRPNTKTAVSRFLFYFTMSSGFTRFLSSRVRGANYPAVIDTDVKAVPLMLPQPSEQRQIVRILDQADHLRKLRADADAKAEHILPAFFVRLFGNPLTNTNLWPFVELGKATEHLTSGSRNWSGFTDHGSARFLRTQDVVNGEISSELLPIDPPPGAEADRTRLSDGDVVITITGMVGKAAVFKKCSHDVYVSQHVALIRLRRDIFLPDYLVAYANFPSSPQPNLARYQYGQTKPGLGFRELKQVRIPKPPIELQIAFVKRVDSFRELNQKRLRSQQLIDRLWVVMLHRAFTGDLTAAWRQAHMEELLQEMNLQAKALAAIKSKTSESDLDEAFQ